MKSRKKLLGIPVILIVVFVTMVWPIYAQSQAPVTANVDRTQLSTDETLTLTITTNAGGMSPAQPVLPPLTGFNVVGSSTSSQISIVNGNISAQTSYIYRLQPIQVGKLVIQQISLTVDGQTHTTEPITIQVDQGTGQAQGAPSPEDKTEAPAELSGQDFFVEAEVDNPAPFLGEPVIYTFRFYQAANLYGQPQYEAPTFTGFWQEQQPGQAQYTAETAGRIYRVTELNSILFPTAVGPVTIEPARLVIPGSFFEADLELETRPVELDIAPLPPDASEGFTGAVGQYQIAAQIDTDQTKVNEPVTLKVTLNGQGNINAAPDPIWPEVPGWRTFESQATINTQTQNGQVGGSRVYERLMVPEEEGQFNIPSIEYVYFDPQTAAYQTTRSEPLPVSVGPGKSEPASSIPALVGNDKEAVEQLATDIRYLKPVPTVLEQAEQPLTERPLYWAAWILPLLAIIISFALQRRQQHLRSNIDQIRSSQARKKASKALAQANKEGQDAYAVAGQVLTDYISDKINQPVTGLTHRALSTILNENGIDAELTDKVETCLLASEVGRFSPNSSDPDQADSLLRQTDATIDQLEKAFHNRRRNSTA